MSDILERIFARERAELEATCSAVPFAEMRERAARRAIAKGEARRKLDEFVAFTPHCKAES